MNVNTKATSGVELFLARHHMTKKKLSEELSRHGRRVSPAMVSKAVCMEREGRDVRVEYEPRSGRAVRLVEKLPQWREVGVGLQGRR